MLGKSATRIFLGSAFILVLLLLSGCRTHVSREATDLLQGTIISSYEFLEQKGYSQVQLFPMRSTSCGVNPSDIVVDEKFFVDSFNLQGREWEMFIKIKPGEQNEEILVEDLKNFLTENSIDFLEDSNSNKILRGQIDSVEFYLSADDRYGLAPVFMFGGVTECFWV